MIYAYIRVSCDKQTVLNQKFEISKYAKERNLVIDRWISEVVSGKKNIHERKLGNLLKKIKKGDIIIISEMSRLGRSTLGIMNALFICMEKPCSVYSVKENYQLGDNLNSHILAFAFSIAAQIEKDRISQRTREALARKKAEGIHLGRRPGLTKEGERKAELAIILYKDNRSVKNICRELKICRATFYKYLQYKRTKPDRNNF